MSGDREIMLETEVLKAISRKQRMVESILARLEKEASEYHGSYVDGINTAIDIVREAAGMDPVDD